MFEIQLTSSPKTAGHLYEFQELTTDLLVCFLEDIYKILRLFSIRLCEERVSSAVPVRPSCPADTMNVVFAWGWVVDVDHEFYVTYI